MSGAGNARGSGRTGIARRGTAAGPGQRWPAATVGGRIVVTQAATSARRMAPSFARMCSRCALTVLGDSPSASAISRVGHALRDQPGDLELAHGQRAPRLVHRPPAAHDRAELVRAAEQGRAVEAFGDGSCLAQDGCRVDVAVRADQGGHEVEPGPGRLPDPADGLPAVDGGFEGAAGGDARAGREARAGRRRAAARHRRARPSRRAPTRCARPSARPRPGAAPRDGRGRRSRRTGPAALAPARPTAASRASSQWSTATAGSPATSAVSARPHSAGRTSAISPLSPADRQRVAEQGPRAAHVAAAEGHVAERVAGAERSAHAAALDELDLREC